MFKRDVCYNVAPYQPMKSSNLKVEAERLNAYDPLSEYKGKRLGTGTFTILALFLLIFSNSAWLWQYSRPKANTTSRIDSSHSYGTLQSFTRQNGAELK